MTRGSMLWMSMPAGIGKAHLNLVLLEASVRKVPLRKASLWTIPLDTTALEAQLRPRSRPAKWDCAPWGPNVLYAGPNLARLKGFPKPKDTAGKVYRSWPSVGDPCPGRLWYSTGRCRSVDGVVGADQGRMQRKVHSYLSPLLQAGESILNSITARPQRRDNLFDGSLVRHTNPIQLSPLRADKFRLSRIKGPSGVADLRTPTFTRILFSRNGLTVRLPESPPEKMRDIAEEESISMNQLVMVAVSQKITRLDAEAQFAHLDALEKFGKAVAEEEEIGPDELMKEVLGRTGNAEPQEGDRRRRQAKVGEEDLPRKPSFKPSLLRFR